MAETFDTSFGQATRTRPISLGEAAAMLRELSEPWSRGEKVKSAIARVSRAVPLGYWRAFDIWYEKARHIRDFEIQAIAAALAAKREQDARNELHELKLRLTRLESLLVQKDPDFHRFDIDALRRSRG